MKPVVIKGKFKFRFECPACHAELMEPRSRVGQEIVCHHCKNRVHIPDAPKIFTLDGQRDTHAHCGHCDYVLNGIDSGKCPECGQPFDFNHYREIEDESEKRVYNFSKVRIGGGVLRFRMPCPHCDHVMHVPRVIEGQIVMCPECELGTIVPEPPPLTSFEMESNHKVYCGKCNYVLNGLNGLEVKKCPECGERFDFNHYEEVSLALPTGCLIAILAPTILMALWILVSIFF